MFENTLAPRTKKVLNTLQGVQWLRSFYLAGGTALALQYGHRQSIDLDFFTEKNINTRTIAKQLQKIGVFKITNEDKNTLEGILSGVKISFMTFSYKMMHPPVKYAGAIMLAHSLDIALMKLGAVTGRNTKKDFIDLYAIIQHEAITLAELVELLKKQLAPTKYDSYHLYKALAYFAEADKEAIPEMLTPIAWQKVKNFFLGEVARLKY